MNLQKKNGLEGRATYESTVQDHGLLAFSDSSILLYASVERSKLAGWWLGQVPRKRKY